MANLSGILDITINDLFSGEIVDMKENVKKLEENLLEMTKQKQESDRKLLILEILVGIPLMVLLFAMIMIASFANMEDWARVALIVISFILIFIYCFVALKIEQVAGYYECASCHHKYVPTYKVYLWQCTMVEQDL